MTWDDPVAAFRDIAGSHRRMFWLDGGGSREWSGRRSLLGWLEDDDISLTYDARAGLVHRHTGATGEVIGEDVFACLEEEIARDHGDPSVNWVGWFGYASRPDLAARPGRHVPDAAWLRCRDPLVFLHDGERAEGVGPEPWMGLAAERRRSEAGWLGVGARSSPFAVPGDYRLAFEAVQHELRRGNSYEVNLTYRESVLADTDPVAAYLRLRALSPAPYAGFIRHGDAHLLSASPERFATIDRNRWVETKPIKGTTPRGATPLEDERQRVTLQEDPRFRAENLMIVDLLRNDVSMVAEPGTVSVPALMRVESYAAVHQLVSTVRGHLRDGVTTVQALRELFPAGSMTGAPKLRTMQIIDAVESTPRGVYAGALGWISGDGRADLGVVIRSLTATPSRQPGGGDGSAGEREEVMGRRWRYEVGTGGGITVHSDVESEYAESRWKVDRLLTALSGQT